ncbi:integrase [Phyllobacterium trifolii]|uniref:Integrase n=1 Tax=Phyllobacterium trifolii TaxID=300193 RepID=A0A839UEJ1_9HYPH|nr:site-specific integrase [Phyllobacterium trifolii]MBB3148223.1 integrase [Phyllobacterium trifolii]
MGTIIPTPSGLYDETGLYWSPCPSLDLLKSLGFSLEKFLDYLRINDRIGDPANLYDIMPSDGPDYLESTFAAIKVSGFSFLKHLNNDDPAQKQTRMFSRIIGKEDRTYTPSPTKRFPVQLLIPFLSEGFDTGNLDSITQTTFDETGRMLAILLLGGSRRSEPLHLWTNDLHVVDDRLVVFLRHPQQFCDGGGTENRQSTLIRKYNMLPRNIRADKCKAGWKNLLLDNDFSCQMHFLPWPGAREFLVRSYYHYIKNVRNPVMRIRKHRGLPDHPFFLINTRAIPSQGTEIGDPYTVAASIGSWRRAFARTIAKNPSVTLHVSKYHGTTPHGLRHLYGHTLASLGHNEIAIQKMMHHKSPLSSRVYTLSTDSEINRIFQEVEARLADSEFAPKFPAFRSVSSLLDDFVRIAIG